MQRRFWRLCPPVHLQSRVSLGGLTNVLQIFNYIFVKHGTMYRLRFHYNSFGCVTLFVLNTLIIVTLNVKGPLYVESTNEGTSGKENTKDETNNFAYIQIKIDDGGKNIKNDKIYDNVDKTDTAKLYDDNGNKIYNNVENIKAGKLDSDNKIEDNNEIVELDNDKEDKIDENVNYTETVKLDDDVWECIRWRDTENCNPYGKPIILTKPKYLPADDHKDDDDDEDYENTYIIEFVDQHEDCTSDVDENRSGYCEMRHKTSGEILRVMKSFCKSIGYYCSLHNAAVKGK